jgi:hypothetical protein
MNSEDESDDHLRNKDGRRTKSHQARANLFGKKNTREISLHMG